MAFGITKYLDIADGKDAPYQNFLEKEIFTLDEHVGSKMHTFGTSMKYLKW